MSVVPQGVAAVAEPVDAGWVEPVGASGAFPARHSRGWLMRRLLLAVDLIGLMFAFLLSLALVGSASGSDRISPMWELALFAASLPLWVVLFRVHGLYDRDEERTDHSTVDDISGVFQVLTLGAWSFLVIAYLTRMPHPTAARLVAFWLIGIVALPLLRAVVRFGARRQEAYVQNVIIVGSGDVAQLVAGKIAKHREYGLKVVGFVDQIDAWTDSGAGAPLIGAPADLPELVRTYGAARVVIAFSADSHAETLEVIRAVQDGNVQIDIVPRMFEVLGSSAQLHTVEGIPLVGLPLPRLSASSRFLKRSFDLIGSVAGLLVLSPVFAVVAVLIKLDSAGPVFFRQVRMGAEEQVFRVFKFRTMVEDAEKKKSEVAHLNMHLEDDPRMFKIPDDPRITRIGGFLRRTRMDELPQLLNVLLGEMSLVGPRPLILDEDRHIERWARRRLRLKPGMTGLWQVLGASDIPFEEMTKLDYLYVTNWSLREDLRLILLTLPALFRARAAY